MKPRRNQCKWSGILTQWKINQNWIKLYVFRIRNSKPFFQLKISPHPPCVAQDLHPFVCVCVCVIICVCRVCMSIHVCVHASMVEATMMTNNRRFQFHLLFHILLLNMTSCSLTTPWFLYYHLIFLSYSLFKILFSLWLTSSEQHLLCNSPCSVSWNFLNPQIQLLTVAK